MLYSNNNNNHQNHGGLQCSSLHSIIHLIRLQSWIPKGIFPDEGSLLLNECDSMKMQFVDVKCQLHSRREKFVRSKTHSRSILKTNRNIKHQTLQKYQTNRNNRNSRANRNIKHQTNRNIKHYEQLSFGFWQHHFRFGQPRFDHTKQTGAWT